VSVLIRLAQVLKVTVEDLIGQPLSLAPNGGIEFRAIPALRAALTDYEVIPATFGIAMAAAIPSATTQTSQASRPRLRGPRCQRAEPREAVMPSSWAAHTSGASTNLDPNRLGRPRHAARMTRCRLGSVTEPMQRQALPHYPAGR
jgi:hypothetical protein